MARWHIRDVTVNRIDRLPLALVVGGLIGRSSLAFEPVFLGVVSGYFVARVAQSLVWTMSGARETA